MAGRNESLKAAVQVIQARKGEAGRAPPRVPPVKPTPEREALNPMQSAGMARRVVPVIDTLLKTQRITQDQHAALKHYRDTADLAHRSPVKSNLDRQIRASQGFGEPVAITSAKLELSRLESILGNLSRICVAVCRDDMSLTQWACEEYGARERVTKGKVVMVPRGKDHGKHNIDWARHELRFAANRIIKAGYS